MRQLLRSLCVAALLGTAPASGPLLAAQAGDCRQQALEHLRASAPDGFAIYKQISDRGFFTNWISCDDAQLDLSTAVHESVHVITEDRDAFPLVDGGEIERPHEVSRFYAPSMIAKKFKSGDYVATYLRAGRSSSATDFLYLLDELNAYSHDLDAAVDLKGLRSADEEVDHRDGLAALMAFVAVYVETAEESAPATWSRLQRPQVAKTIAELWGRAEGVMASSCGIPDFGSEDITFLRQVCRGDAQASLQTIIGRPPVCPTACLKPTPEADLKGDADPGTPASRSPRHNSPANLQAARIFLGRADNSRFTGSDDLQKDQGTTKR